MLSKPKYFHDPHRYVSQESRPRATYHEHLHQFSYGKLRLLPIVHWVGSPILRRPELALARTVDGKSLPARTGCNRAGASVIAVRVEPGAVEWPLPNAQYLLSYFKGAGWGATGGVSLREPGHLKEIPGFADRPRSRGAFIGKEWQASLACRATESVKAPNVPSKCECTNSLQIQRIEQVRRESQRGFQLRNRISSREL